MSILPNIIDVCAENGIQVRPQRGRVGEYRANCPFHDDHHHHLYLNSEKNTFKCMRCANINGKDGYGGVVRFMSLLSGRSESSIIEELKEKAQETRASVTRPNQPKRKLRPAEKLNAIQLKMIGFTGASFYQLRKQGYKNYYTLLEWVWDEWQSFISYEIMQAHKRLLIGIGTGEYAQTVADIKARSEEIGVDLLTPALNAYTNVNPPEWVREAQELSRLWLEPQPKKQNKASAAGQLKKVVSL